MDRSAGLVSKKREGEAVAAFTSSSCSESDSFWEQEAERCTDRNNSNIKKGKKRQGAVYGYHSNEDNQSV